MPSTEFDTFDQARTILDKFAARHGVRLCKKRYLERPDGTPRHMCLACECHSVSRSSSANSKKSGCMFLINLNRQQNAPVRVTKYYAHHNHARRHEESTEETKRIGTYRDVTRAMRATLLDCMRLGVPARAIRWQLITQYKLDYIDMNVLKYAVTKAREAVHGPNWKAEDRLRGTLLEGRENGEAEFFCSILVALGV